jgi:hypothetical protein
MICAKNDMMERSREMVLETWGWRTLIATEAVGTDGGGSWRITGPMAAAEDFL